MIAREKAEENLKVIRDLMERPVRYSTQSGLAGIIAGASAICGLVADIWVWNRAATIEEAIFNCMFVWIAVLFVALCSVLILTHLRETKQGIPHWSKIKVRIFKAIALPFVAGAGLSAIIILSWFRVPEDDALRRVIFNQGFLVPALWMLFYGIACWQVGEFSVIEMRIMGAAFVAAGLITALFFQDYPYVALGITFGGFHIFYGVVAWVRHGG